MSWRFVIRTHLCCQEPKRFKEEDQHRKPRMRFITDGQNTNENDSEASIAVASDMKCEQTKFKRDKAGIFLQFLTQKLKISTC